MELNVDLQTNALKCSVAYGLWLYMDTLCFILQLRGVAAWILTWYSFRSSEQSIVCLCLIFWCVSYTEHRTQELLKCIY